jgi:hypothetical protein
VKTPIDTDSLVLGICKNQLGVMLNLTDIRRSHPIGEILFLFFKPFFLGCLFCFSLNLSDHFVFYFEFPEELMHLCCAGWFLDEVAYIHQKGST